MAPNNSVKVVDVFRVSPPPTSPDSASPSSLPFTLFDILWLRFPPVQRVFFYEIPPTNASFLDSILPKLKHSLSLTLQDYLPLAGTLTWPKDSHKPIINYIEGDSVSLTLAESRADFYLLSGNNCFVEAEEYHSLVPHLPTSHEQAQVLALQVTIFSNCGFCIGITAHHAVLDGKSSTMFMKSWANLCKHGGLSMVPELTPSYDRTVIKDPAGLEGIFLNHWMNHGGPNNKSLKVWELKTPPDVVRGTFELSRAKIQKLRQLITTMLEEKNQQKQPLQLSTYTITCAYTWVCLAKAEGVRDAKFIIGISVDARRRMEAPIPATYFGNCIGARTPIAERNELLGEDGVVVAVNAICEAITSLDDGVLSGSENWLPMVFAIKTQRLVGIAGSPRFELYNTDFGWGRPRKVEMISIDRTGAICLSDSRDGGGGIEIGLALKKQEMEVFASLFSRGLEAL
ncbi:malonyl-CoA:anthocyanidin 5-O-glucoside-6''-O-malonyltransferase-like [Corylus avellana]|uniref:malonyl-CoA:anthocyanidin 5-O-glucoside-6''-O-malonyltransferase-like n=1 Tax=Corylus avellana TaxID=13451 RepID=UPI001E202EDC|nr:malonyl-CoA:anthocyanidin 5-O-glucoside-6''-O-malonyltransferase-like [Corylus avellana]